MGSPAHSRSARGLKQPLVEPAEYALPIHEIDSENPMLLATKAIETIQLDTSMGRQAHEAQCSQPSRRRCSHAVMSD